MHRRILPDIEHCEMEAEAIDRAAQLPQAAATPCVVLSADATLQARDAALGGQEMRAGDKVLLWYVAANRDPEVFPDPHRFDITRTPNEQGAFGTGGAHFCLGSHLARREVTAMFVELFRRLPDIEATAEPERLRSNFIGGIKRMRVAYAPGPRENTAAA